jgi:hypothetical protein
VHPNREVGVQAAVLVLYCETDVQSKLLSMSMSKSMSKFGYVLPYMLQFVYGGFLI